MLLGGRAGDILGRRRFFMVGLVAFVAFSLLCSLSTSSTMLIVARFLQGMAGAILSPSVFSIVSVTFAEGSERNTALGILGAIAGSGAAIGVLLGVCADRVRGLGMDLLHQRPDRRRGAVARAALRAREPRERDDAPLRCRRRDGHFDQLDSDRTTSSELPQAHLPGACVVKAFNAIRWDHLRDGGRPAGDPERLGIPISGDDPGAKRIVAELIEQIGFDPVDAGTLAAGGRKHQPASPIYTADLPSEELRARLAA